MRIIGRSAVVIGFTALTLFVTALPAHADVIFYSGSRGEGYGKYTRWSDELIAHDTLTSGGNGIHVRLTGTRYGGEQGTWAVLATDGRISPPVNAPLKPGTLATMRVCVWRDGNLNNCLYHNFSA